uniref:Odorant-binding protein 5 n=1 Tax=Pyrrhalta maculicollis TaxID=226885 RepID=A0A1J0KKF1_9CUCU|nr:odorant-binding protein 5 [Pyrrhalta maculicollis]
MKILSLICFFAVFVSVYADSYFVFCAKYITYYIMCGNDAATSLNRDDLKNALKDKPFNAKQLEGYLFCLNKHIGVQNEQGDYVPEQLKEFFKHVVVNQDNLEKIVHSCSTRPIGSSAKDAALSLLNCAKKLDTLNFPFLNSTLQTDISSI